MPSAPVRLVIDGRWAQEQPRGGVGRGIAALVPLLAAAPGIENITLLTDIRHPPADLGVTEVPLENVKPNVSAGWLQWSAPGWLARHGNPGTVFWCPWYGLPYRQPVPMAATIHDLTFEHRPEWFSRGRRATFRAQARHAARGGLVFTPSDFVRRDVIATYRMPADRVVVTPNAADGCFGPAAPHSLDLPETYVVALGGAARRRLDLAVAAWRLSSCEFPLLVLGEGPPGTVSLGRLPDDEWAGVLAGARALIYPTEYEGFGMPAAEALACGTPVVAARVGALPEIMGDDASWADSLLVADLARALDLCLSRPRPRPVRRTSWETSASLIADSMVSLAAESRGSR